MECLALGETVLPPGITAPSRSGGMKGGVCMGGLLRTDAMCPALDFISFGGTVLFVNGIFRRSGTPRL